MRTQPTAIPIHNASPAAACGGCLSSAAGLPVCRASVGDACEAPTFTGAPHAVQQVLDALAGVLADAGGTAALRALRVQPGEVELQLRLPADCGGAALADAAFQALRALLPDTDIYVLPGR